MLAKLRQFLDEDELLLDAETRKINARDNSKISRLPELVIQPKVADKIGSILKLANEANKPITTRGSGTCATGACVPLANAWTLNLSRLQKLEIDARAKIAEVEAGVITAKLQEEAEKLGLFYPPDPSSNKYSSIGGNLACNAGGLRCFKYGVSRDYVLEIRGFFANGKKFRLGRKLRKFTVGFDLKNLIIGSEGTLAVISSATLRLLNLPRFKVCATARFSDEDSAIDCASEIVAQGLEPAALEFIDKHSLAAAMRLQGEQSDSQFCALLVELDSINANVIKQERSKLAQILAKSSSDSQISPLLDTQITQGKQQREDFWSLRKLCSQAMFAYGKEKINNDFVIPQNKQKNFIAAVRQLEKKYKRKIPCFGHIADGNIHANIMFDESEAKQQCDIQACLDELMRVVTDLDGAISGEHGIGLSKSKYLQLQLSQAEIEAMQSVKKALDPNNILNPDKIFTPTNIWQMPRDYSPLPWDRIVENL